MCDMPSDIKMNPIARRKALLFGDVKEPSPCKYIAKTDKLSRQWTQERCSSGNFGYSSIAWQAASMVERQQHHQRQKNITRGSDTTIIRSAMSVHLVKCSKSSFERRSAMRVHSLKCSKSSFNDMCSEQPTAADQANSS